MKSIQEYLIKESKDNILYNSCGLEIKYEGNIIGNTDEDSEFNMEPNTSIEKYSNIGYRDYWKVIYDKLNFYYKNELYFSISNCLLERSTSWDINFGFGPDNSSDISVYTKFINIYKIRNYIIEGISNIIDILCYEGENAYDIIYDFVKHDVKELMNDIKDICEEDEY